MRLTRSSSRRGVALLALALAAPAALAQSIQLPKLEQLANMLLSAQGIQQAMQDKAATADTLQEYSTQSEVWSAFLNAASNNLDGGSLQAYASKFDDLKYVCGWTGR